MDTVLNAPAHAAQFVVDALFIPLLMVSTVLLALYRNRHLIATDENAIWAKVIPAALAGGGLGVGLVSLVRLFHSRDPHFCAELTATELASMYALVTVVGLVGGIVAFVKALKVEAPRRPDVVPMQTPSVPAAPPHGSAGT